MRSLEYAIALAAVLATVALLSAGAVKTASAAASAFNNSLSTLEAGNYCFTISLLSSSGESTAAFLPHSNYSRCGIEDFISAGGELS